MGLRSYGIIVAAFFTVSIAYAVRYGYGMLLPGMLDALKITKTEAGIISAAYFCAYTVFSPVLGVLSDRCSARLLLTVFQNPWPEALLVSGQFFSGQDQSCRPSSAAGPSTGSTPFPGPLILAVAVPLWRHFFCFLCALEHICSVERRETLSPREE